VVHHVQLPRVDVEALEHAAPRDLAHADDLLRDLEAKVLLDSGTLSPLLRRLEKSGLVAKKPFADDGRVTVLALTAKGRKLRERAVNVPEALVCRMLAGQQPDAAAIAQIGVLRAQLKALVSGLAQATKLPQQLKKRSA
jgi:DNA-binding MarR family transcriptional regulator